MKKVFYSLVFFDGSEEVFSVPFELPSNVNPIALITEMFVNCSVVSIDVPSSTIKLVLGGECHGKEEVR